MLMEQEKSTSHLFAGLLIGGALGALAGIFLAPKAGKQLRADIREKGNSLLKDAKEIYADANMKAKEILDEARHQAMDLKKDADRHLLELKKDADRHFSETRAKTKEILARHDQKQPQADAVGH